jgi:hypothetical protein
VKKERKEEEIVGWGELRMRNLPCISTRANNPSSNVILVDCTFISFSGNTYGGVIYCPSSSTVSLSISDSKFTSCSATQGGAIYSSSGGSVEIVDSNFTLCSATYYGAIYLRYATSHVLNDILFEQCSATNKYGAMYLYTIPQESTFQRLSCLNCESKQWGAIAFSEINGTIPWSMTVQTGESLEC